MAVAMCASLWMITTAAAATVFELRCSATPCSYKGELIIGDAMEVKLLSGYCAECKCFQTIKWNRFAVAPKPAGAFWDHRSGVLLTLYHCPKCKGLILPITDSNDIKCCPKCGKSKVEVRAAAHLD